MKTTQQQLRKVIQQMNQEYKKEGSDYRAYLTGDPRNPIGLKSLADASFPERTEELILYKLTKPL